MTESVIAISNAQLSLIIIARKMNHRLETFDRINSIAQIEKQKCLCLQSGKSCKSCRFFTAFTASPEWPSIAPRHHRELCDWPYTLSDRSQLSSRPPRLHRALLPPEVDCLARPPA